MDLELDWKNNIFIPNSLIASIYKWQSYFIYTFFKDFFRFLIMYYIIFQVGKVLPNKSQTFTVTFAPNKNDHYESWAYLDVSGSSDRLPLKLSGQGKGPYISLNVKVLNIGDVFLCATHNYEVAVKNEGS